MRVKAFLMPKIKNPARGRGGAISNT